MLLSRVLTIFISFSQIQRFLTVFFYISPFSYSLSEILLFWTLLYCFTSILILSQIRTFHTVFVLFWAFLDSFCIGVYLFNFSCFFDALSQFQHIFGTFVKVLIFIQVFSQIQAFSPFFAVFISFSQIHWIFYCFRLYFTFFDSFIPNSCYFHEFLPSSYLFHKFNVLWLFSYIFRLFLTVCQKFSCFKHFCNVSHLY